MSSPWGVERVAWSVERGAWSVERNENQIKIYEKRNNNIYFVAPPRETIK